MRGYYHREVSSRTHSLADTPRSRIGCADSSTVSGSVCSRRCWGRRLSPLGYWPIWRSWWIGLDLTKSRRVRRAPLYFWKQRKGSVQREFVKMENSMPKKTKFFKVFRTLNNFEDLEKLILSVKFYLFFSVFYY